VGDITDILLVGHDPHDSDQLLWALEVQGLARRTKVTGDADEALDYLLRRGSYSTAAPILLPRLILLDISSLSSPGVEVLRKVKTNQALRAIPTVVLTRSVDQATDIELIRAGANSVVARPRAPEKLRDIMGHVVLYWMLVNRPAIEPAMPQTPPAAAPEDTFAKSEPLRILIADATFSDAEPAINVLENAGYRLSVEVATRLEEFVHCVTELGYDVIVSESTLPGWDLTDAAAELAENKCTVPLIVLTSTGSVDGMRGLHPQGSDRAFAKRGGPRARASNSPHFGPHGGAAAHGSREPPSSPPSPDADGLGRIRPHDDNRPDTPRGDRGGVRRCLCVL
jgi:two-component system response regulator